MKSCTIPTDLNICWNLVPVFHCVLVLCCALDAEMEYQYAQIYIITF